MARRLRLPSWVADQEEESKQVPPIPLRHLISKVEKAFDLLDDQEESLEKAYSKGLDIEEYERLKSILYHRRQALHVRRLKESGEYTPTQSNPGRKPGKSAVAPYSFSLPNWVWWLVFTIIICKFIL